MVSEKSKVKRNTFLNWEKQTWYWEKRRLFSIGIRPLEKGRKSPEFPGLSESVGRTCHLVGYEIIPAASFSNKSRLDIDQKPYYAYDE